MGQWLAGTDFGTQSVCLNLGSSTRAFREQVQPFIHSEIVAPLERRGVAVVHCDLKADEGVDEVGDVLEPAVQAQLASYDADLLICSNMLEHLADIQPFVNACARIVRPGGLCLITVPRSFPYLREEIAADRRPVLSLARQLARAAVPFYRPLKWWPATHKLFWLFRDYRVSLVMLRRPLA
jgi:SAM-dependent methyltransferase